MRKFFIFSLIILLAVMGWMSLRWAWPVVEVVHPLRGTAVQAVYATGTVEPTVMMPIASRITAQLMTLKVDEGAQVTKGQVLARLEDDDSRHSIEQLQSREEYARKEYMRYQTLVKQNSVSKSVYDKAKSEYAAAQAATRSAEAQAGYLTLTAPADGVIIRRDGEVGQLISANTPVFWLSCCAPLRISTEVDEEDIALVKPDQAVVIRADAFPDKVFHGKVQAITPKGDPVSRSYRVRVVFTEETPLHIGMTAETNIIISERKDAMLVPSSAISKDKIWLVKDGRLVQQAVKTGARGPEQTEITEGVTMEDTIVAKADAALQQGQKVQARMVTTVTP